MATNLNTNSLDKYKYRDTPQEYFTECGSNLDKLTQRVTQHLFHLAKNWRQRNLEKLSDAEVKDMTDEVRLLENIVRNAQFQKVSYYLKAPFIGRISCFLSNLIAKVTFGKTPLEEANDLMHILKNYRHTLVAAHQLPKIQENADIYPLPKDSELIKYLCFAENLHDNNAEKGTYTYPKELPGTFFVVDDNLHVNCFFTENGNSGRAKRFIKGINLDQAKTVGGCWVKEENQTLIEDFRQDVEIHRFLETNGSKLPKIKLFIDNHENEDHFFLVKCCNQGTLGNFLAVLAKTRASLSPHVMPQLMLQIATNLAVMHKNRVIHSDIKVDNILVHQKEDKYKAYLNDFDLAFYEGNPKHIGGQFEYLSPQQIVMLEDINLPKESRRKIIPTRQDDIWKLGLVFSLMLFPGHQLPMFQTKDLPLFQLIPFLIDLKNNLKEGWWNPPGDHPLKSLIASMLSIDPAKRPTIEAVVEKLKPHV